ncbi:cytochrome P450 26B1 [Lingula anatina]|uniref:Cytochrome P450 26B1 n=1 Tax=Lingula anatina TaxID=7574 RepID=A0A1S3IZW1_LINAN|nr:cytochrome P450 26B1 [Lingula anatina]|eukprot:XP_013403737.1 cytochrome P450 26B1 [Lingula anatina]
MWGNACTTEVLILAAVVCFVVYLYQRFTYGRQGDPLCPLPLPPGAMGMPFLGETIQLMLKKEKFYEEKQRRHGNVFKTNILAANTIRVIGSENVAIILRAENNLVTTHWPKSTYRLFGPGALHNSVGDVHRQKRMVVMKAFSPKAMGTYVQQIQRIVRGALQDWCVKDEVLVYPECKRLSFAIGTELLVGLQCDDNTLTNLLSDLETVVDNIFSLPVSIPGFGLWKGLRARKRLDRALDAHIRKKLDKSLADWGCKRPYIDALDRMINAYLLDAKDDIYIQELKDSAVEMMFAGHHTTASAACSLIYLLHENPLARKKLHAELIQHGWTRDATVTDLDRVTCVKYLDHVVNEVLRLVPPAGGAFRKVLKTFELDGYQIPKGWSLVYSIRQTQHQSPLFSDSKIFDPDMWEDNPAKDKPFDFFPFGGGRRHCIGRDFARVVLKILAAELVTTTDWQLAEEDPVFSHFPTPKPVHGLPTRFKTKEQQI